MNELIVAPVMNKPVSAIATVASISASSKFQIVNLELTELDTDQEKHHCRLSVSYIPKIREQSQFMVGSEVWLQGVLTDQKPLSEKPESWLLDNLQSEYQFHGEIELVKRRSQAQSRWDVRTKLRQVTMNRYSQNPEMNAEEGLLESIVFGGNTVSLQMHQIFLRAGVLHVLAASGANMLLMERMMAPLLIVAFGKLPFGRKIAFSGLLGFIWLYAMLCGCQASILRAAWMSSYRTIGKMVSRMPSTGSSIGFAALCMSIYSPSQLWSISAILSFVATYAVDSAINLPFGYSVVRQKKKGFPYIIYLGFAIWIFTIRIIWTSISVELYTAPLVEALFGQWTPYAVFSNLLIEPILALLLPSAAVWFVLVVVSTTYPLFGFVCDTWAIGLLSVLQMLERILTYIAALPGSLVTLPVFPPVWFIGYYTCLLLLSSIRPSVRPFLKRKGQI